MLHITNGDSAARTIREAGIPGEVLPWRDVLHEGPVPDGLALDELRVIRARFIAESGWSTFEDALNDFTERDRLLAESPARQEVVLWFEHDLYDQLQLLQILDWIAVHDPEKPRLSLISAVENLGSSSPERLRERFAGRRPVSREERELGRRGWAAFRSSDPTVIEDLLRQDTSPLPHLRGAFRRHMEQFPSVTNGLSRSEAQALEAIAGGVTRLGCVYVASHHEREESVFLGDAVFALYIEGLSRVKEPLVVRKDGRALEAPRSADADREFWESEAKLTPIGRAVLEGREDRVGRNGLDRWLGGVHLSGPEARWRWDPSARRLSSASGTSRT